MIRRILPGAKRGVDLVGALLFATMFVAFVIQILARYVFGAPVSWTFELSLLMYVWLIFWACAFMIDWRDHVNFPLLLDIFAPSRRRLLAMAGAGAVCVILAAALPATVDWLMFMNREKTPVFKFRVGWAYSIAAVFMVALIARAAFEIVRLLLRDWRSRD